ncbi:hypothetical protein ACS0TY_035105 [Phlomoides rotata]
MGSFSKFVQRAYSLPRDSVLDRVTNYPRMLIISRNHNQKLVNEHKVCHVARGLGFDVTLAQLPWNLTETAELVNKFDVMVGMQGAGLTNIIFLPENVVLVQITPYGVDVEAQICFEDPEAVKNRSYGEFHAVYLGNQDLRLDLDRFKKTLFKVSEIFD